MSDPRPGWIQVAGEPGLVRTQCECRPRKGKGKHALAFTPVKFQLALDQRALAAAHHARRDPAEGGSSSLLNLLGVPFDFLPVQIWRPNCICTAIPEHQLKNSQPTRLRQS